MDNQTILTIALVALVVVLTVLLVRRIRKEKRQLAALKRMSLAEFGAFLRSNSVGGNIAEVAGKVSDLLKSAFGCDAILFLRKKRRFLEVNYYHGLTRFDRRDFRAPADRDLMQALSTDFLPRSVEDLRAVLSDAYVDRLRSYGLGLFFPVFWRENLYGVYFVRSTIETRSTSFNMMVAALAQSLAAAYHIKWHESRYEMIHSQLERAREAVANPPADRYHSHLLRLVRHRNTQTLIPKLIESIRMDLGLDRIAYVYPSSDGEGLKLITEGLGPDFKAPEANVFATLCEALGSGGTLSLNQLLSRHPAVRPLARVMRAGGLDHLTSLPSSSHRPGILIWGAGKGNRIQAKQIEALRGHALDLINNVENYERVEEMSQTDGLTGLANQRYFARRLEEEIKRAKRYDRTLALIMFDLDELKAVNDTHGHQAGDALLREMGHILRNNIRAIDIIARYGGDEFCIIMPEADEAMCRGFMERLNREVSRTKFTVEGVDRPVTCTVSLGGSVFPTHADTPRKLIFGADMALLRAKEQGRNKAVLYEEQMTAKS